MANVYNKVFKRVNEVNEAVLAELIQRDVQQLTDRALGAIRGLWYGALLPCKTAHYLVELHVIDEVGVATHSRASWPVRLRFANSASVCCSQTGVSRRTWSDRCTGLNLTNASFKRLSETSLAVRPICQLT